MNGGIAYAFGKFLKSIGVKRVYELGCGVGSTTLAIRLVGISVTGFDVSAPAIDYAWRNARVAGLTNRVTKKADANAASLDFRVNDVTKFRFVNAFNPGDVIYLDP